MNSSHERCLIPRYEFMVWVLKKLIYKAIGPLTRCRPNVDQGNDHATRSGCAAFCNISPKRAVLGKKISLTILFTSICLHLPTHAFIYLVTIFLLSALKFNKYGWNEGEEEEASRSTCLWRMLWAFKHWFCKDNGNNLQFWACFLRACTIH